MKLIFINKSLEYSRPLLTILVLGLRITLLFVLKKSIKD